MLGYRHGHNLMNCRFLTMLRTILHIFLITTLTAVAFLAIRFLIVEPDEVAAACAAQATAFSCKIRSAAIFGFSRHLFGPISLVAAALAWVGAMRLFAVIAMMTGIAGMVLYDFDLAGFGMLLGAVLYARIGLQRLNKLGALGQDSPGQ